MNIHYDRETDTLLIALRDERIKESDEVSLGVIADVGYDGDVVRFEILDASRRVADPLSVTLEMTRLLANAGVAINNAIINKRIFDLKDIKLLTAIDDKRDRAVINEGDLHIRAKLSGFNFKILLFQFFNKSIIKIFRLLRISGLIE